MPNLYECPACNQTKGAKIIYGMPVDEIVPYIEQGLLVAGGCMMPEVNMPYYRYQCTGCGTKFGERGSHGKTEI